MLGSALASQLTPPYEDSSSSSSASLLGMSALESLPAMPPAWQDPWAAAEHAHHVQHQHQQHHLQPHFMQHQPPPPHHLSPHHLQAGQHPTTQLHPGHDFYSQQSPASSAGGNNKDGGASGVMNSSSDSGSSSNSGKGGGDAGNKRTVNFKLEIKPEPELVVEQQQQRSSVQKVPSISDLSEAESSLDIPAQVREIRAEKNPTFFFDMMSRPYPGPDFSPHKKILM